MTKKPGLSQSASQSPNGTVNNNITIVSKPMPSPIVESGADCEDPLALPTRHSYYARDDVELGHMGSISHSADLLQHKSQIEASVTGLQAGLYGLPTDETQVERPLSESQLRIQRLGVAILECLPDEKTVRRLGVITNANGACFVEQGPTTTIFGRRFWDAHGTVFERPHVHSRLVGLANLLSRNTLKPLNVPRSNSEWFDSVCNFNSRWELVGACIIDIAVSAFNLDNADPFLRELIQDVAPTRRDYCCRLLDAADACYRLCTTELKQNNKLTVSLFIAATWLQSMVGGDSSLSLHMRKGAALAALTAFGMHEYREEEERLLPRAFVQDMRQIVALVVILDTVLATFCGRPPALSTRYVSCPLPWDMNVDEAVDDSVPVPYDATAWSPSGKMSATSRLRASIIAARIRQEILELCLGPVPLGGDVRLIIDDLRLKLERAYQSLPAIFHIELDRAACDRYHHEEVASIYGTRLTYLHSHFLIARYEQARGFQSRFIEAAQQMLSLTNCFYNVRDRMPGHNDELHWHVCSFGIPAASALAIDLWKSKSSQSLATNAQRSQTILDLSVFISALEWVDPAAGNITLCRRAHRMIKHILDYVLAPPPAPDQIVDQMVQSDPFDIDGMSLDAIPTFGVEFENFFDNIDWNALPWDTV